MKTPYCPFFKFYCVRADYTTLDQFRLARRGADGRLEFGGRIDHQVKLRGHRSNRDGLGALVTVRAGDDVYTRYHDGKSGYLSQSSLPLYFGLGNHQKVDRIEVVWPSGALTTVAPVDVHNTVLEIAEAEPSD